MWTDSAGLSETASMVWSVSLGLGLVITMVVALLLWWIIREARAIDRAVAKIWAVGQRVANNTIHIPLLYRTNALAGEILANAGLIAGATVAIEAHARQCPGCPHCLSAHADSIHTDPLPRRRP